MRPVFHNHPGTSSGACGEIHHHSCVALSHSQNPAELWVRITFYASFVVFLGALELSFRESGVLAPKIRNPKSFRLPEHSSHFLRRASCWSETLLADQRKLPRLMSRPDPNSRLKQSYYEKSDGSCVVIPIQDPYRTFLPCPRSILSPL